MIERETEGSSAFDLILTTREAKAVVLCRLIYVGGWFARFPHRNAPTKSRYSMANQ